MARIAGLVAGLAGALLVASAGPAWAIGKYYKYDQFSQNIASAAEEIASGESAVQPAFAAGEAFGQLYKPEPGEYPVRIQGLDIVFAAPPDADPAPKTHMDIEVWIGDGDGPAPPPNAEKFVINTAELAQGGAGGAGAGQPVFGGAGLSVTFDYEDADGHPPIVYSGNIWVMLRFPLPGTAAIDAAWGSECALAPCGCQPIGTVHDNLPTPQANVLHFFDPSQGGCDQEANTWAFFDQLPGGAAYGDIVMRIKADVNEAGCVPSCVGKECGADGCGGECPSTCEEFEFCNAQNLCEGLCEPDCAGRECGSDGCGGVCGSCADGEGCDAAGQCVPLSGGCSCADKECGDNGCGQSCGDCTGGLLCADNQCVDPSTLPGGGDVTVTSVSPSEVSNTRSNDITIQGTGFQLGVEVRLGAEVIGVKERINDSVLIATVPEGFAPGTYLVLVVNPDDSTGTLVDGVVVTDGGGGSSFTSSEDGCAGAGGGVGGGLALAGLALALARRRRAVDA